MSQSPSLANGPTADTRRRARLVLWAAGVIALLGLVGGGIASSHLTSSLSDYDAPSSAVVLAQHQIQRVTGSNPEEGYVVVVRTAAPITTSSAVPARVASVVSILRARPEVKSVLDYANTANPSMISSNGTLTTVVATVGAVNEQKAVTALQKSIAAQPSLKGNTWLGGPTVAGVQIATVSSQDLGRAELYALPFLLLLLFFVFRGLRAAAVPLVGAVFAIAVTLGVMGLALVVVPLSIFALNLVIALGIGLSVDFSLLIISRFREEFGRGVSIDGALATVRRTAGHTVLFSSLTIAAALATLTVFPERFVYSMGVRRRDRRPGRWCVRPARPAGDPDRVRGADRRHADFAFRDRVCSRGGHGTSLVRDGHPGHAPAHHLGRSWRVGDRGPGLSVPPRRLHRRRCQRSAGQQLSRIGLHPGPDPVPVLLRGARRSRGGIAPGDASGARHLLRLGGSRAGRQGSAGLPAPGWVVLGVERGPHGRTLVADCPAGRRGDPSAAGSRAGDGHRTDRLLP